RMLRLINQLLEFRKMQNNKLSLSLEETDVVAFLHEIFISFNDVAHSKNMEYQFFSSHPVYRMFIDKGKIDKIAYNLLSNAFKYTPSGGRILLNIIINDDTKELALEIADNGVGVPKEKQADLFTRFMQSRFSNSSMGVGLHLSNELATVHRARLSYADQLGGGSIFTLLLSTDSSIYLPTDFLIDNPLLLEESLEKEKVTITEIEDYGFSIDPLNKRKILIIEDDTDVREFLKVEIGKYFEVQAEADGIAGFERARTYDADLIICDVLMPGMTGYEVVKKLREDFETSHIPIILLTAMSSTDNHLQGIESGADAYITKPFSPKLLLTRIFKLIEQRDKLRKKFSNDSSPVPVMIYTSDRDKKFAEELHKLLEEQLDNPQFTVDEFAASMGLGRTVFYRKVRAITGTSPNEFIRVRRMNRGAELLLENKYTVAEVSYKVGINDPFYFSKCFKQQFGVSPSVYQKGQ
ncbi:MAG: hybrid sensor histidine kinase/response regulator transcription factor, partial [Phocaeicola sp.]